MVKVEYTAKYTFQKQNPLDVYLSRSFFATHFTYFLFNFLAALTVLGGIYYFFDVTGNPTTSAEAARAGNVFSGSIRRLGENSSTDLGNSLAANDNFGRDVTNIGDIDGNGADDLAVGAPGDDGNGSNTGAVYILLMNPDQTVKDEYKFGAISTRRALGDNFGFSLDSIGDIDNDGQADLLVGAPGQGQGKFYAVYLNYTVTNPGLSSTVSFGAPRMRLFDGNDSALNSFYTGGILAGDARFGAAIAGYDQDLDGTLDYVMVGAPENDPGNLADSGSLHLFEVNIQPASGTNALTLTGTRRAMNFPDITSGSSPLPGDAYGSAVADIGDVDGNGFGDIAVGVPGINSGRGGAYLVRLESGLNRIDTDWLNYSSDQRANSSEFSKYGSSIELIHDVDGNGYRDIAVGSIGTRGRGSVTLNFINSDGTDLRSRSRTISDERGVPRNTFEQNAEFGAGIAFTDRLDGNTETNGLFVGAPFTNQQEANSGVVFDLPMQPNKLRIEYDNNITMDEDNNNNDPHFRIDGVFNQAETVELVVTGGTATLGDDYNFNGSNGTVSYTIQPGFYLNQRVRPSTSAFDVLRDGISEPDETIFFGFGNLASNNEQADSSVTFSVGDSGLNGSTKSTLGVTIRNDDFADFIINDLITPLTLTEGEPAQIPYTLELDAEPTNPVTINIASSDATAITPVTSAFTFDNTNWDVPQNIEIIAPNDTDTDSETGVTLTFSVDSGSDAAFVAQAGDKTRSASVNDSAQKGFSVTPNTPQTINESGAGNTVTYDVVLSDEPTNPVQIDLSNGNINAATITSPASQILTFDNTNWNTSQGVTLTGALDANLAKDQTTVIFLVNGSSDSEFIGALSQQRTLTVTDTTVPTLQVIPTTPLALNEQGSSQTFSLTTDAISRTPVYVDISSANANLAFSPSRFILDDTNYNDAGANAITVSALNDNNILNESGIIANFTVSTSETDRDQKFDGVSATGTVDVLDNDFGSLVGQASSNPILVGENGGTNTFVLRLSDQPNSDVVLDVTSSDLAEMTVSPATLTFTPTNWNQSQSVVVSPLNDANTVNEALNLQFLASGDVDYDGLSQTRSLTINDDDAAELIATPNTLVTLTEEDATGATYTVNLSTPPAPPVEVDIALDSSTPYPSFTVSPSTLTFTPANYNATTGQTVTVTAGDDANVVSETGLILEYAVDATLTGRDATFDGQTAQRLVNVNDNDAANIVVNADNPEVILEDGGTGTFTVALSTQPASNVVLDLTSTNTAEATVYPSTLTFTPANFAAT